MATIYVDGRACEVDEKTNLLEACLQQGVNLPYFCWHPALGSVGSCRQCAVTQYKDENDTDGKVVMACMTPAKDGTRISLQDNSSSEFRAAVIEWMMTNHPHDCPVCEEGGECHLQDMTVMTGHNYRRFTFNKRTFRNQDLGPFLNHEMNRCITCYRCVRFYDDYAGGTDLGAFALSNRVYFGRHEDGPLESEFSGNLAEVCPTGVFTDKTLSDRYSRKWDLRTAPSVCPHCSLGCNISPGERYGTVKRVQNRYNGEINGYFICDRGRYGYDFVNRPERLRQPLARTDRDQPLAPVDMEGFLPRIAEAVAGSRLIGIGSPRASVESNYALRKLVGEANFFTGVSARMQQMVDRIRDCLRDGPVRTPTLRETEQADAVLILGEDLTQTAPRLALSLRQAVRNLSFVLAAEQQVASWQDATVRGLAQDRRSPLINVTPWATRLDDVASHNIRRLPTDMARLGYAIANAVDDRVALPEGLDDAELSLARELAATLSQAKRPLIVSGTGSGDIAVVEAAANLAWALARQREDAASVGLTFTLPAANSMGLSLLGGAPLEDALAAMREGDCSVIVAEHDLSRETSPGSLADALAQCRQVIALDSLPNPTTAAADRVLPAGTFAETSGTLVNNEGRAQRYFRVLVPEAPVQESWRWLVGLATAFGRGDDLPWKNLDDVIDEIEHQHPGFTGIRAAAPPATHTLAGLKAARETPRFSGRTAMDAGHSVHEPRPPRDIDGPLTYTMEGHQKPGRTPSALIAYTWTPGWNSEQSVNKFQQEIGGSLKGGDPGQRLLAGGTLTTFYQDPPRAMETPAGKLRALGQCHIFGSEELSSWSPPIRQRTPEPYLGVSQALLEREGLAPGDPVLVLLEGETQRLPVRPVDGLPDGAVTVPVGLSSRSEAGQDWPSPAGPSLAGQGQTDWCEVEWHPDRGEERL